MILNISSLYKNCFLNFKFLNNFHTRQSFQSIKNNFKLDFLDIRLRIIFFSLRFRFDEILKS